DGPGRHPERPVDPRRDFHLAAGQPGPAADRRRRRQAHVAAGGDQVTADPGVDDEIPAGRPDVVGNLPVDGDEAACHDDVPPDPLPDGHAAAGGNDVSVDLPEDLDTPPGEVEIVRCAP